jgi:hypothetical protein
LSGVFLHSLLALTNPSSVVRRSAMRFIDLMGSEGPRGGGGGGGGGGDNNNNHHHNKATTTTTTTTRHGTTTTTTTTPSYDALVAFECPPATVRYVARALAGHREEITSDPARAQHCLRELLTKKKKDTTTEEEGGGMVVVGEEAAAAAPSPPHDALVRFLYAAVARAVQRHGWESAFLFLQLAQGSVPCYEGKNRFY